MWQSGLNNTNTCPLIKCTFYMKKIELCKKKMNYALNKSIKNPNLLIKRTTDAPLNDDI